MRNRFIRLRSVLAGTLLSLAVTLPACGQSLDLTSKALIGRAHRLEGRTLRQATPVRRPQFRETTDVLAASRRLQNPATLPAIAMLRLDDPASAQVLQNEGFDVHPLRQSAFAVATGSFDDVELLAAHPLVKKVELSRQRRPALSEARAKVGIDQVHAGEGLPQTYTGQGVITAIVDGGFDPNHVNFKDQNGASRFDYFATCEITSSSKVRVTNYPASALANFTSDDNTATHGTHTLGIMAGSYKGEATVGTLSGGNVTVGTRSNPYYGVAPDSRLYASSGSSYDGLIAYAIDYMLEDRFHNFRNKPIVVNLSLGGNQGPHDGSGALSQYIDWASQNDSATFCISAGNEGDIPIALNRTLTAEKPSFATFIRPYVYTDLRYGIVEIYSDTEQDFDVSVIIYNAKRGQLARTFPCNNKEGTIQYICSSDYVQTETDIVDATFSKAYEGYVGVASMKDEDSGRFYAAIDYYLLNSEDNPASDDDTSAQYTVGFLVTGHDGQRIDCFCDGTFTALDSYGVEGYEDGMYNGTISDMATTKQSISVGSYNTCEYVGSIEGYELGYDGYYKLGDVTEYSSFGTLVDGRQLPHVLAPGCLVVSSISTPYFNNASNQKTTQTMTAVYDDGTRKHYWEAQMGTSMASPMVAGSVALMLEADPTLLPEEVRDILTSTAVVEDAFRTVDDPVQYGAGRIDVYAALSKVLERTAVQAPTTQTPLVKPLVRRDGDGALAVSLPGRENLRVRLVSAAGQVVRSASSAADALTLPTAGLPSGVYILQTDGAESLRLVVR